MSKIKVKLLNDKCMPVKTHRWDAGWDLKTTQDITVKAGETTKVHTGVIFEIPPRHMGMVVGRSGLGTKHRITLANDVGIIDSEYRGEILVFLSNDGDEDLVLNQYDRFAQIIITPINTNELWAVANVSETGRGDGGFGSTGIESGRIDGTVENVSNIPKKEVTSVEIKDDGTVVTEGNPPDGLVEAVQELREMLEEVEDKEDDGLVPVSTLTPAEYMKLKNSGMFYEVYPEATGTMTIDLNMTIKGKDDE